jgi:hypothetical protein
MANVSIIIALISMALWGSQLGDLAASMKAGEWKEFLTQNLGGEFLYSNVNSDYWYADMSTTWSNYLTWNPATREIHWTGAPHMAPYAFIRYTEATNAWTSETNVPNCMRLPQYQGCFNHGYDLGTIDQENGVYYYKSTSTFFSYVIATKTWSQWSISQFAGDRSDAMEYFPPLKKLAHVIGGTVKLINPATRTVETVATGLSMGSYDNTMEYSVVHRKLYFGGAQGSRAFYSMDSSKKTTRLADAPESYDCNRSSLACDPVTGTPLILANSNKFYAYNASSNQWTTLASPPARLNSTSGAVAAMATGIPEHGVVFYMSPPQKRVYLYKFAENTTGSQVSGIAFKPGGIRVAPHPFHSEVRISRPGLVHGTVEVFSPAGRRIARGMIDEAGSWTWNAARQPSGVYLLKICVGKEVLSKAIFLSR